MSPSRLVDNFLQQLQADGLIRSSERILVGLSGGSDSVALLYLLRAVAPSLPFTLVAAHLDHAMRPQSGDDVAFVRALCGRLNIPLHCERVDVPALAATKKVGLEEAGRLARQAFLSRIAAQSGCTAIALGHHRGDQAETILHHLARGCGLHGLACMRRRRGLFVRPLLTYSKAELLAYLKEIQAEFVVDASNDELNFTRNRIRHQFLPLFATLNPQIEATLGVLAAVAAHEDDYWQGEMVRLAALLVQKDGDTVSLSVAGLLLLHPAQRYRLLHLLLTPFARKAMKEVGFRHVSALDLFLASSVPQGEVHLPGVRALRRYDQLSLSPQSLLPIKPSIIPWSLEISGPGFYPLPSGGALRIEPGESLPGGGEEVVEFDAAALPFPWTVRRVQPGDRLRLAGMSGRKRLKELLMEQKIPLEERRRLYVLATDEILWVVGVRRSGLCFPRYGQGVWRVVYLPSNSSAAP
ncbi:MAG: tRNA lysidine(34) synthetase TilS [Deltaproteobacteria bacterium HGW-Deltaproteobacteria-4]|nr:MAG: tRNA lysidine(34) synthetase TilS [Deltaproteobacteria bacterium HGW-Deltaproteobacteria-4]